MKLHAFFRLLLALAIAALNVAHAATGSSPANTGDQMLAEYFRAETEKLSERCLADIKSPDDWKAQRERYRQQLFDMMGLSPLPERGDLKAVITGRIEHDALTVEKLHFQAVPGLYITANLYLPKGLTKPVPTILYVCGHGPVITNKVSYGNKVSYQHHGAWFARNGYVCLIIDTVQWGEILGAHHGTYRDGAWWWNARGYTPAGVEAWSAIRALDYLSTRSEVDTNRFGITGRSGGGAYSWFTAALDDRVKVIAPVAGITDLHNHVVDGTVEGHCDCMFFLNTFRWDYPLLAALAAPRPLLLVNTDSDNIFPLDGVMRTHAKVRHIYGLLGATNQLGLVLGPGPHKDTQDLQVPVFRWFNKYLKGEDPVIEMAATKLFTPQQLKVFESIPGDAINTNIQSSFVPVAQAPAVPSSAETWNKQRDAWLTELKAKCFGGWPEDSTPPVLEKRFSVARNGLRFQAFDFDSQPNVRLRLYTLQRANLRKPERVVLGVLGQAPRRSQTNAVAGTKPTALPEFENWLATMKSDFAGELAEELAATTPALAPDTKAFQSLRQQLRTNSTVLAWLAPRGVGLTAWSGNDTKQRHLRRRFMLLGQTLDGMRVWDIRRATQAVRSAKDWRTTPLWLQAEGALAGDALHAALFEPGLAGLDLWRLPVSHQRGPDYLNVLRVLDVPQAVAMAAERCSVRLHQTEPQSWAYPTRVASALGWDGKRFVCEREP